MERRKPLRRGGPLKRKTKLVAKKPLSRQAERALTESSEKLLWLATVTARGCEVCHGRGEICEIGRVQAHHVITRQALRAAGLSSELKNPENGLGTCYRAHRRHHNRIQPIERSLLRPENLAFAERHGLMRLIEKYYPT